MEREACGRCVKEGPKHSVIHCTNCNVPGGLYLCLTCHATMHPGCSGRPRDLENVELCAWCQLEIARMICPQCSLNIRSDYRGDQHTALCVACADEIHTQHRKTHLDHVIYI